MLFSFVLSFVSGYPFIPPQNESCEVEISFNKERSTKSENFKRRKVTLNFYTDQENAYFRIYADIDKEPIYSEACEHRFTYVLCDSGPRKTGYLELSQVQIVFYKDKTKGFYSIVDGKNNVRTFSLKGKCDVSF